MEITAIEKNHSFRLKLLVASVLMLILLACMIRFISPGAFKHGDGSELVFAATVELLEAIKTGNITSFEDLIGIKFPLRH